MAFLCGSFIMISNHAAIFTTDSIHTVTSICIERQPDSKQERKTKKNAEQSSGDRQHMDGAPANNRSVMKEKDECGLK